jgi:hypothetical protein
MQARHLSGLWKFLVLLIVATALAACGGGTKSAVPAAAPTQPSAPAKAAAPTAVPVAVNPTVPPKATEAPPTVSAKPTETPPPAPTAVPTQPKPTEAPQAQAPTGQAGIDLMLGAMRAQLAQKAFRMNLTTVDGGETTNMTIEYVAPDSFHSKMSTGTELIVVKGASYMKGADGKWQKSPIDMSAAVKQILSADMIDELAKSITVDKMKFLGPDLLDGKPMWVYQYDTTMDLAGTKISTAAKVWLGVLDKLPYKQEGESDSVAHKGSKTKTSGTWEYDPNIKIEAPIK